jgi:hypothetical protein
VVSYSKKKILTIVTSVSIANLIGVNKMYKRTKHNRQQNKRHFVARHSIKRDVPYVLYPNYDTGCIEYREATQEEIAMFKEKFPQLNNEDKPA